jgi:glutathione S-transferase
MENRELPVLWHLKISSYNEKARWALDFKKAAHVRRAVDAGPHARVAKRLSGGRTFPIVVFDGEPIGDSTRIIEALEARTPDPPLYPADPELRARALELEDFFDEQFGAYVRLLFIHSVLPEPALTLSSFAPDLRGPRRVAVRAAFPLIRRRVVSDFGIDDAGVAETYAKIHAAGELFQAEVRPSGYLVGDTFTVADLTLAALAAPPVAPDQLPYATPHRGNPRVEPLRRALSESRILEWTREMYARHRGSSAEIR